MEKNREKQEKTINKIQNIEIGDFKNFVLFLIKYKAVRARKPAPRRAERFTAIFSLILK